MTPEATRDLAKAGDLHARAQKMLEVGLAEDAAAKPTLRAFPLRKS